MTATEPIYKVRAHSWNGQLYGSGIDVAIAQAQAGPAAAPAYRVWVYSWNGKLYGSAIDATKAQANQS